MKKYSLWNMIYDIAHFVRPYRWRFLIGAFFRGSSDMANLFPAFAFSRLVTILTEPITADSWNKAIQLIILWIIFVYYYRIGHDLGKYFGFHAAWYAGLDAKYTAIKHMYTLDLNWHEKENSGNKIKRIDNASKAIKRSIEIVYNNLIEATINLIGICIIFWSSDFYVAISIIVFVIFYFILSYYFSDKVSKKYKPISKEEENYEGLSFESINNIRTMKMLLLYSELTKLLSESLSKLKLFIHKFIFINRIRNHILDFYTRVFEFGIMIYIVYQITHSLQAIGILILFRSLFWKVIEAIGELSEIYNDTMIDKVYMSRFKTLLSTKPTIELQPGQVNFPDNWEEIKFNNLSFAYADKPVLKNLNLTIKRGEKVGIVGISGAGKSTFVKLILDLYENYEGNISYDDVPLRDIKREDYIDHVSTVSQDTELFNTTLKENIMLGRIQGRYVSDKEFKKVCDIANLEDIIAKLPLGVETIIGEKGFKLSGGERQRVGIARAVIRNPQILVLDEATSHLDSYSEQKIQEALEDIFKNVTAIVIAHRLSTLTKMDRIIVLENGEVVEEGTMNELIKKNGKFAFFWNKQNQKVE